MEFKKPKQKKKFCSKKKLISSLKNNKEIIGVFNGQFVTVSNLQSMNYLYKVGSFGKGTLSRGEPNYHNKLDDIPKMLVQHQFENYSKWNSGATYSCPQKYLGISNDFDLSLQSINELLQSSFADSEKCSWKIWKEKQTQGFLQSIKKTESNKIDSSLLEIKTDKHTYKDECFVELVNEILQSRHLKEPKKTNYNTSEVVVLNTCSNDDRTDIIPAKMNSTLESLPSFAEENLNLSLEESFFLKFQCRCLNIVDLNLKSLDLSELWEKFNVIDKNFTRRYITYNYYKTKGWVIKSGLKFGGDFLLYKDGPVHYHSSYLLKVLDDRKKITWKEFIMMNRLVETFKKDLILCNVVPMKTSEESLSFPAALKNNSIEEILVQRWFPSKERFSKESRKTS